MKRHERLGRRSDSGAAAVEFALVLSMISLMLMAIADFGLAYYRAIQVSDAVNYATSYKVANPDASEADVEAKAAAALDGIDGITVQATTTCRCNDGQTQTCTSANQTTCEDSGGVWREYLTVEASASITPIVDWPGIPNPIPLSAASTKIVP